MSLRRTAAVAVAVGVALSACFTWTVQAQVTPSANEPPTITVPTIPAPTTTTTPAGAPATPGSPTSTTTPPGGSGGAPPGSGGTTPAGQADPSQGGDGGGDCGPICPNRPIPPDAQAVLDAIVRSAPNDDHALVAAEQSLLAAGHPADEAARLAYGRFPVAGPATWVDDWLNPRWTGTTFRYHLGLDLVAPYGTPLRSPDDGIARIESDPLGGLAVQVVIPDGSFYYLAHMSATAEGLRDGQPVHTGDLLGYVGQSGDATGPHCHFGIYAGGTTPIAPKPLVDGWVADAEARLTQIPAAVPAAAPAARPLLGTGLVRELTSTDLGSGDLLYATSANPSGGALQLAQAAARDAAGDIDWATRAREQEALAQAWAQSSADAWSILGPLTPKALRPKPATASP